MNKFIYACDSLDLFQLVTAKNIPATGDFVLLTFKMSIVKFKVVSRFINHSGKNESGMEPDMYVLQIELA
ncbi:hypothetical protein SAMN04487895_101683 [Paenibacillus sophorae]|uniref:Uncharacterized protein n=1 Tax=Paenibacillus sophorae TaxID=1333845 RepID=A0A1H8GXZ1_9BACL|nr:hypothetical protein [Paenibacillus sophorae]QWU14377.1 hypothetical protein KP014_20945 [Paenibacillus sophorae]SEN48826.1 hypothetical protein SAMN04487895_101683 [Paenibacillus sophorae]